MGKRKGVKLAERVAWRQGATESIRECFHGEQHVKLFQDARGFYEVIWQPEHHKRFRVKGGWEPAQAEALRIVQFSVLYAAEAWSD